VQIIPARDDIATRGFSQFSTIFGKRGDLGLAQFGTRAIVARQMVISGRFARQSRDGLRGQRRIAERPYDRGGLYRIERNQPAQSASESGDLDSPAPAIGSHTTTGVGG
jgi:hypothetical protein